jgi:hypothetical protein
MSEAFDDNHVPALCLPNGVTLHMDIGNLVITLPDGTAITHCPPPPLSGPDSVIIESPDESVRRFTAGPDGVWTEYRAA